MKKPLDPDKPLSENPAPLVDEALGPVDKVSLDLSSRTFSVEIARKWHTVRRGQNRE